jgi:putative membrane protein
MVVALILAAAVSSLLPIGFSVQTNTVGDFIRLFLGVAVLSVLNATLGKILKFLTIPLNCMTFGLMSLVINAAMFMAAGSLELGFSVKGFLGAFVGSLLYSLFASLLQMFLPDKEDR